MTSHPGKSREVPGQHPREQLILTAAEARRPPAGCSQQKKNGKACTWLTFTELKENNTKVKMKQSKAKQELNKKGNVIIVHSWLKNEA